MPASRAARTQPLAAVSSLLGALLGAVVALQVGVVRLPDTSSAPAPPDTSPTGAAESDEAAAVATSDRGDVATALAALRSWDARRAAAWEAGDEAALRRLWSPGADAAAQDLASLRRYDERGLVVSGLTAQVRSVEVLAARSDRVVLVVEERPHGTVVRRGDATVMGGVPATPYQRHRVELVRRGGADGDWVATAGRAG